MVLISHENEFIFIKTQKSASSSLEESLEFYLLGAPPEGFSEESPERMTSGGYVSGRGFRPGTKPFMSNHITSRKIAGLLGEERFSNYLKATSVRNPWDQIVSYFWWRLRNFPRWTSLAVKAPMSLVKVWFAIWYFTSQSRLRGLSFTYRLMVNRQLPSMHIIRFESIETDLKELLEKLGCSAQERYLPNRKAHIRLRSEPYQSYYFDFVRKAVAKHRSRDLKNFGYKWIKD